MSAGISISPFRQDTVNAVGRVTVRNAGTLPLKITTYEVQLSHGNHSVLCAVHGVKVTPAAFTLSVGGSRMVTVDLGANHGDVGVVFDSVASSAHGYVVGAGVGAQFVNGNPTVCAGKLVAAPVIPAGGGFPWGWVIIPLAILAAVAAVLAVIARRYRPGTHI